jgi:hypothetical protein
VGIAANSAHKRWLHDRTFNQPKSRNAPKSTLGRLGFSVTDRQLEPIQVNSRTDPNKNAAIDVDVRLSRSWTPIARLQQFACHMKV